MAKPRKDGLCSRCKNAQSNTYSNYCKLCTNKMQAAYKKANGYKHNKARELRIKDYIRKLKSEPCVDCNVAYPWYVMDFDHVRGEKKFNLSIAPFKNMALSKVQHEIDKCDLVCANCHRSRTYSRTLVCIPE